MHLKEEKGAGKLHAGSWKTMEAALGSHMSWWDPGDLGPSSGSIPFAGFVISGTHFIYL